MKNIKVSNCCGASDRVSYGDNSYQDFGICPDCKEHCTFIPEEDYDTPLEDSGELENQQDEND